MSQIQDTSKKYSQMMAITHISLEVLSNKE